MKVVTCQRMAEIDRTSIDDYFFSEEVLMENAGIHLVFKFLEICRPSVNDKIIVICGGGNNGGDGYVIARQLFSKGFCNLKVISISNKFSPATEKNRKIATRLGLDIIDFSLPFDSLSGLFDNSSFIIDCMFGTGLRSALRTEYHSIVNDINDSEAAVVSVDIPSGIYEGFGEDDVAVCADYLFTVELLKNIFYSSFARRFCGKIFPVSIGFPKEIFCSDDNLLITRDLCQKLLAGNCKIDDFSYKNKRGHVCVVAGCSGYLGAASLCSKASTAFAGLVSLLSPSGDDVSSYDSVIKLHQLDSLQRFSSFVIGSGVVDQDFLLGCLKKIQSLDSVAVFDAGIFNLSPGDFAGVASKKIFTPHIGEFCNFFSYQRDEVLRFPEKFLRMACLDTQSVIVLKSSVTLVGLPSGQIFYLDKPSVVKATAGSGDLLAGIIGSFAAAGFSAHEAAILGVFVHSLAADLAFQEKGLVCADIFLEFLPKAVDILFGFEKRAFFTEEEYEK
ncbi:MAG: NAD(P)H-hydrate epimerase [Spirochaetales bacterium]|nr:NAD(P)H-hydrate epimerase [Spirochaetales bacterium]